MNENQMPQPNDMYTYRLNSFTVTWDESFKNGPFTVNLMETKNDSITEEQ